ncbi:hypothetical protein C8F04DRAFT_1268369 [Mycena alexandri]|uniref:Uncharacterized protein n=1 Tax=Mycena alexandri TaxID=1745969 RepID=A0AAD6WV03_9AGAR|nr:hypothetical protein C8F04DRAFT_1268369 [Mycena alexandri]
MRPSFLFSLPPLTLFSAAALKYSSALPRPPLRVHPPHAAPRRPLCSPLRPASSLSCNRVAHPATPYRNAAPTCTPVSASALPAHLRHRLAPAVQPPPATKPSSVLKIPLSRPASARRRLQLLSPPAAQRYQRSAEPACQITHVPQSRFRASFCVHGLVNAARGQRNNWPGRISAVSHLTTRPFPPCRRICTGKDVSAI